MTLKEKIAILEAMEKGLTIQYSETDGETDDWEDLLTSELDFSMYEYRVKPEGNPDARFGIGDQVVHIAAEGTLNPQIFTVKGFTKDGEYTWEESSNKSDVEAIDVNYINIKDVYWFQLIHYRNTDRYSLMPTMVKLDEIESTTKEECIPVFEMGFRIPRKD